MDLRCPKQLPKLKKQATDYCIIFQYILRHFHHKMVQIDYFTLNIFWERTLRSPSRIFHQWPFILNSFKMFCSRDSNLVQCLVWWTGSVSSNPDCSLLIWALKCPLHFPTEIDALARAYIVRAQQVVICDQLSRPSVRRSPACRLKTI